MSMRARLATVALALLAWTVQGEAQEPYPTKPMRLVVPNAPGGGMDAVGRVVAKFLGASLAQAVTVENRPGAAENVGINFVAKAPPDGYTLLLSSNSITMNPFLYKSLPYDAVKDLLPVGRVTTLPLLIVSHSSVPVRNVQELIDYARANPDKLSYGSPGNGTPHHLAMELFKSAVGVKITHVAYKGTGPSVADILGGHIPLIMSTVPPIQKAVQAGQVRALGTMEKARLAEFKDVPSVSEAVAGFEVGIWHAVMVPSGTPPAVLRKLTAVLESVVKEPQFREQMAAMGVLTRWGPPEEVMQTIKLERSKWSDVIKKAGIQAE